MPVKKLVVSFFCIACVFFFAAFQSNKKRLKENPTGLQFSFNYKLTTPLLNPPYISGVIDDPTDPAATQGIVVDIKEKNQPINAADYTLAAESDNLLIVHNDKIIVTKENGQATIKIIPSGFGYSDITLTLTRNHKSSTLDIHYAASAVADFPSSTFWHTNVSDASAVVALDSNYMLVADDEVNALFVYHRYQSGLPVAAFNYSKALQLPDGAKEIDCEAGVRSLKNPENVFWAASMSNGGTNYKTEPNRNYLFETSVLGTGVATKFAFTGYYNDLRSQLIKWGDANGYKLSAAAAYGVLPKQNEGFNIEGIAFAPDSTTLYIGFRAPIIPITNRTKALIAPIEDFEKWFNNGHSKNTPVIGKAIELNLGGRGIRDFVRLANGSYAIIAGNSDEILNAALYTWSGLATDAPVLVNTMDVYALKIESGLEINDTGETKLQVISDNGSNNFYNDGVSTKFLNPNFKKFRSDIVPLHQEVRQ